MTNILPSVFLNCVDMREYRMKLTELLMRAIMSVTSPNGL